MRGCYFGVYRGVVAAVNDPEKRFRYRVRVYTIHDTDIPAENLPWAETAFCWNASKAKLSADLPNFDVGDGVWIMFEGGDRRYPVITGGWIMTANKANDVPTEQAEDYDRTRKRWQRIDRKGNLVELSELDDELHVRLRSGGAEVVITQKDNSITLRTTEGVVRVEAPKAEIVSTQAVIDSREVTIRAGLVAPDQLALSGEEDQRGRAHMLAHVEANVHALNPDDPEDGTVNLGGYTPKDQGQTCASALPLQSPLLYGRAKVIKIGVKEDTMDGENEIPRTVEVEIYGADFVKLISPKLIDARVTDDDAAINIVNEGDGDIVVRAEGGGDVNIESTESVINLNGSKEVNVFSKDDGGKVTAEGQTLVKLKSDVKIKLEAPSIEIG